MGEGKEVPLDFEDLLRSGKEILLILEMYLFECLLLSYYLVE